MSGGTGNSEATGYWSRATIRKRVLRPSVERRRQGPTNRTRDPGLVLLQDLHDHVDVAGSFLGGYRGSRLPWVRNGKWSSDQQAIDIVTTMNRTPFLPGLLRRLAGLPRLADLAPTANGPALSTVHARREVLIRAIKARNKDPLPCTPTFRYSLSSRTWVTSKAA